MNKDPMGTAISAYYKHGKAGRLRVFAPDFDEDEIPVEVLYRKLDEMPMIERLALGEARGHILDVGAAAGPHSLVLQAMNKRVTAIDLSALSVETMTARGVRVARQQDFWDVAERFDTILMLMNGIGIVGTLDQLPRFFCHLDRILAPGGQVLLESTDIRYLFEDEDGTMTLPLGAKYYGEMSYRMQYEDVVGEPFDWLYIDYETLAAAAESHGYRCELVAEGEEDNYLAALRRYA